MSGSSNGAQVNLSKLVDHEVYYITCQAHRMNTFHGKKMLSFDFIVSLIFMKNIMYKLKMLTETWEKKISVLLMHIPIVVSSS